MFPISEILELLAMVKGEKPRTVKRALKIAAKLAEFVADQIPDDGGPVAVLAGGQCLQSLLEDAAGAFQSQGSAAAFDGGFLKLLLAQVMEFVLSKFLK